MILCYYSRIFTINAYKRGPEHKNLYSYSGTFIPQSDLSLAALYWHVVACAICGNHIMSHMFNSTHDEFEDTKGIIRIRKSKKDRQHKGQMKKGQIDKDRSTKHTHRTKDRVARA